MEHPLERLRHHVTGAIERGEREPIIERPAEYRGAYSPLCNSCWLNHPHTTAQHFASMSESATPGTELHRIAVARGYIATT